MKKLSFGEVKCLEQSHPGTKLESGWNPGLPAPSPPHPHTALLQAARLLRAGGGCSHQTRLGVGPTRPTSQAEWDCIGSFSIHCINICPSPSCVWGLVFSSKERGDPGKSGPGSRESGFLLVNTIVGRSREDGKLSKEDIYDWRGEGGLPGGRDIQAESFRISRCLAVKG